MTGSSFRWRDCFFDAFLLAAGFILLTSGTFWIEGPLAELIRQKPALHRLAMMAVTAAGLLVFAWRDFQVQRGKAAWSPLISFLLRRGPSRRGWLWILFFAAAAVWTASAWIRHAVFHTSFDMAIFVQAVWNTAQGDWFYSSIKGGINLMADHFSPLLGLLALPYKLWPDPRNLLLMQALAAAACVFPLYRLAAFRHGSERPALLFVLAFLLYLPVRNAVRFDFHPEILAMPLLLWAFYFVETGRRGAASVFLFLTLLSKEGAAPVLFAFGLFCVFFRPGARRFGFFWMVLSILYFFTAIYVIIPKVLGESYFYLDANFLSWVRDPSGLISHLARPSTIAYGVKIFAPFAFLSFLDFPAFFLTWPSLAQNLLSRNEATRSIFFQYTAYLTPFVVVSAIYGAARIRSFRGMAYAVLGASLFMTGISEFHVMRNEAEAYRAEYADFQNMMRGIPADNSVRTHEFLAPHLAHRREIHIYENTHPREGGSQKAQQADYVILYEGFLGGRRNAAVDELQQRGYQIQKEQDGFLIFSR